MTRRLIKPNLKEIKKSARKEMKKKPAPPYKTHAENYYYIKQMNNRTPMVIELINGEVLKGKIEWYDEKCIKIKCDDESNFIIFKHVIKYMYKDPDYSEEKRDNGHVNDDEKEIEGKGEVDDQGENDLEGD
jgi:host factor-I protein